MVIDWGHAIGDRGHTGGDSQDWGHRLLYNLRLLGDYLHYSPFMSKISHICHTVKYAQILLALV